MNKKEIDLFISNLSRKDLISNLTKNLSDDELKLIYTQLPYSFKKSVFNEYLIREVVDMSKNIFNSFSTLSNSLESNSITTQLNNIYSHCNFRFNDLGNNSQLFSNKGEITNCMVTEIIAQLSNGFILTKGEHEYGQESANYYIIQSDRIIYLSEIIDDDINDVTAINNNLLQIDIINWDDYELTGVINFNGDIILNTDFISIELINNKFLLAFTSAYSKEYDLERYGLFDLNGVQLVPTIYTSIDCKTGADRITFNNGNKSEIFYLNN